MKTKSDLLEGWLHRQLVLLVLLLLVLVVAVVVLLVLLVQLPHPLLTHPLRLLKLQTASLEEEPAARGCPSPHMHRGAAGEASMEATPENVGDAPPATRVPNIETWASEAPHAYWQVQPFGVASWAACQEGEGGVPLLPLRPAALPNAHSDWPTTLITGQ